MAAKTRYRIEFKFWLNINKPDQEEIADDIERWKNERQFAKVIRDGLRLMKSLQQRDTSVLLELFPWIGQEIDAPKSGGNGGNVAALEAKLAQIEGLLLQQNNPESMIRAAGRNTRPKKQDDEPALIVKKSEKTDSAQNFLNSLMALQG